MGRIELDGEKIKDWANGHLKPSDGIKEGSHTVFFLNGGRVVFWPNVSTPTVDYAWALVRSSTTREAIEQMLREKKIKWYNAAEIDWALGRITFKSLKELKRLIAEYIAKRKYEAYATAKRELILRPLTATRPRTKFYAELDEKSFSEIKNELEKQGLKPDEIISFTWREDMAEAATAGET